MSSCFYWKLRRECTILKLLIQCYIKAQNHTKTTTQVFPTFNCF
ncbi:hypothetical protein HanXRQr2_Chr16g0732501 [Helianthus annuus]|uniref:Uncharacterized protein n=1 Tax=Helianthus annuus TaxID=4232 RepID=A0A9K3DQX7_HELAN|nr:hypothetical protein HanXRQr2_Chr16g0732501 [Helianthus annuus]KAJ0819988.1 hypothetical protein HanPSC8_Chr16g0702491 [Helianthus annuus]